MPTHHPHYAIKSVGGQLSYQTTSANALNPAQGNRTTELPYLSRTHHYNGAKYNIMLYTHYVTGQPLGKLCAVWWPPAIYVARAKHTSKQRNAHVGMHTRAGGVCLLGETPLLGHTSSIM